MKKWNVSWGIRCVDNQNGTAIITALLILMLLTFVALVATNTTMDEKAMVRSEAVFEQVFDLAESADLEGIQLLADASADCSLQANVTGACTTNGILDQADLDDEDNDMVNLDKNGDNIISGANDFVASQRSSIDATNNTYRKIYQKKIEGGSLGLDTSRNYSYNAYGFSEKYNSRVLIKMGYRKRF
jgi:Tfp pilus assembly protein PilX